MIEAAIAAALGALVGGRCSPDTAPPLSPRPYIVYQQVGGQAITFIDAAEPSKRNARMQVEVWADSRGQATALAWQVERILCRLTAITARPLGAFIADEVADLGLYGTRQDFDVWGDPPA